MSFVKCHCCIVVFDSMLNNVFVNASIMAGCLLSPCVSLLFSLHTFAGCSLLSLLSSPCAASFLFADICSMATTSKEVDYNDDILFCCDIHIHLQQLAKTAANSKSKRRNNKRDAKCGNDNNKQQRLLSVICCLFINFLFQAEESTFGTQRCAVKA